MEKLKKSPYLYEYQSNNGDFMYVNSYTNLFLKIHKEEKKQFDQLLIQHSEQERTTLIENGILVPEDFNIEVENKKILKEFYEKKEKLHLIILPTEGCNFRCKYCYENHEANRMSEDTIEGIVNFVREKLPEYKYLHT